MRVVYRIVLTNKNKRAARIAIQRAVVRAVADEATILINTAREDMKAGKTGRKHPRLPNRSSAPGESPATQSGAYAASIRAKLRNEGMEAEVGPDIYYAKYLEAKNRPTMRIALQKRRNPFIERIKRTVRENI